MKIDLQTIEAMSKHMICQVDKPGIREAMRGALVGEYIKQQPGVTAEDVAELWLVLDKIDKTLRVVPPWESQYWDDAMRKEVGLERDPVMIKAEERDNYMDSLCSPPGL